MKKLSLSVVLCSLLLSGCSQKNEVSLDNQFYVQLATTSVDGNSTKLLSLERVKVKDNFYEFQNQKSSVEFFEYPSLSDDKLKRCDSANLGQITDNDTVVYKNDNTVKKEYIRSFTTFVDGKGAKTESVEKAEAPISGKTVEVFQCLGNSNKVYSKIQIKTF